MKPSESTLIHHVQSAASEDVRMQLDVDAIKHLMAVLTNLYSDPVAAVVREYSTNALDSHIEAGQTRPVEVTVTDKVFTVQDWGVGMSVDDLRDVYSMYGKSTKRGSDAVAGMLGLGCKSGLTYAMSFTVIAVQGGVKTVAIVTRDTDGVGVIKILDTLSCSDHDGVSVTVPIKRYDEWNFKRTAKELFRHWPTGTVLINGDPPEGLPEESLWLDPDVAVHPGAGDSHVVMGGVPYPFTPAGLNVSVTVWVPMGSVDFTPSREALHMTSLTLDTLEKVHAFTKRMFGVRLLEAAHRLGTPYERGQLLARWRQQRKLLTSEDRWRLDYAVGSLDFELPHGFPAWQYTHRARRFLTLEWDVIDDPATGIVVSFPHKGLASPHRKRLRTACAEVQRWVVIPHGVDVRALDGHPRLFDWNRILATTEKPPPEKTKRSGPNYTAFRNGVRVPFDGTGTLTYASEREAGNISRILPGVLVVPLAMNRIVKFKRLYPTATPAREHHFKLADRVRKSLTPDDLLTLGVSTNLRIKALGGVWREIHDKDLRRAARSVSRANKRLELARTVGVGAPEPPLLKVLERRYPLLFKLYYSDDVSRYRQDILLYVNAKARVSP